MTFGALTLGWSLERNSLWSAPAAALGIGWALGSGVLIWRGRYGRTD
jgi:hypothetical protein